MSYLLSALVFITLSAAGSAFYQAYLAPKLIAFGCLVIFCASFLAGKREIVLPEKCVLVFCAGYIVWAMLLALLTIAPLSSFYYVLLASGIFLLYGTSLNFSEREYDRILYAIVITGLLQTAVAYLQFFQLDPLLPGFLLAYDGKITGSIGNPEFLATLLGFAIFALLHLRTRLSGKAQNAAVIIVLSFLFSGIVLAKSKGTLAFLLLFAIWKISKSIKLTALLATAGAALVVLLFPDSIYGRLFLWVSCLGIIWSTPLLGVGPRQFADHYLESVHALLGRSQWLSEQFGSYTGHVLDAHNLFLNHWIELGLPGLAVSILATIYCLRLCRNNPAYLAAGLAFLIYKSLYTVILNSLTGAILFAITLAILTPKAATLKRARRIRYAVPAFAYIVVTVIFTGYMSLSDYHHQQGLRRLMLSDLTEAERHFALAQQYNSESSNAYLALANVYYQRNAIGPMKQNIDRAIFYEKSMDSYKISAHMLFFRGEYDDALPLYEYIHVAFPTHLTTMGKLSLIYLKQGDLERAAKMAETLLNTRARVANPSDDRNYKIGHYVLDRVKTIRSETKHSA